MNNRFIERTLNSTLELVQGSLFAEETAAKRGLLQSVDPRARAVSLLLLLGLTLFTKNLNLLVVLYGVVLCLALASRVELGFFLLRTWLFIPLFTTFVAIPALFDFITPGPVFYRWGPLVITHPGVLSATFFVLRVTVSVSIAVLMSLTTRHFELLKVLRSFGVPQVFVMVTGMAYRYIYLLVEVIDNTHRALKSRIGSAVSTHKGQKLVAWNMAVLWLRSYQLSDQVYGAMRSRGYRGEPVVLNHFRFKVWDVVFVGSMAAGVGFLILAVTRGLL